MPSDLTFSHAVEQPKSSFRKGALLRWVLLGALLAFMAGMAFWVRSQTTPPSIPSIGLTGAPLYSTTTGDKPTMALALSVEFPTVGAQYRQPKGQTVDSTYSNTNEYLGYYDAESCYTYVNSPSETPATGQTAADFKRFQRTGAATSRMCTDAFSGNFLNWASNSAIDMLRLALSGGDRYIDQDGLTILQRAVLPNGDPSCFWNSSSYFPAKRLTRAGGSSGSNYWGAVPNAVAASAGTKDLWISSTLNRIYFSSSQTGSCSSPSVTSAITSPPTPNTKCSKNETCTISGTQEVWQESANAWTVYQTSSSFTCTATSCYILPAGTSGLFSGMTSEGYFYSRVQVCDVDASGNLLDNRDYTFCTRYPSGKYKPTGVIQKYSKNLRLAAFGYAMDQVSATSNPTTARFGGVLRAPMKYVGQSTFDQYGVDNTPTTGNARAEWNATTGVFVKNPESDAMGISGVINYLNQFGRTNTSNPGIYKQYDPVAELYHETLAYLQGRQQPTTPANGISAVSGLTTAMYDGFPIYGDPNNANSTAWDDPYAGRSATQDYSCLKSNVVVIGDINTWDGGFTRFPGYSNETNANETNANGFLNSASNYPNYQYWAQKVSDFEANTTSSSYVDGQGTTRFVSNLNTANTALGTVAVGDYRKELWGLTYWAHTHDIRGTNWTNQASKQRPGLRVKTFLFDVNENSGSSDDTTRRTTNQYFMAAKYGGFNSQPSQTSTVTPYNTWGNPFKDNSGTANNNVWQKSTTAGEAEAATYYLQSNPRQVLAAFDDIFYRASASAYSIAGVSSQSSVISSSAGTLIYQASFDTSSWSGDLQSFAVTLDSSGTPTVAGSSTWSASQQLGNLATPASSRNIVIGSNSSTAGANNFTWDSLTSTQQAALNKPGPGSSSDGNGQLRLNYLRGDRTNDGVLFRNRSGKLLGDIVNSGVIYSGKPASGYTTAGYKAFVTDHAARTPVVFVGANDGMLHAFNASTGAEVFGYIPGWLTSKLSLLTNTTYNDNHQGYVDATPAVADAQLGTTDTSASWKTVLVGGTGAGGKGVYALDVSDPGSFTATNALWEFTSADDADMGQVIGTPRILKFRTSAPSTTPVTYKWYVVVASGVNNYVTDAAGHFSSTGQPAIFLLDLSKPSGTAWQLGTNYFKVSLPIDSTLAATQATGATNFSVALNAQEAVGRMVVGDLQGRVWLLNFDGQGSANWNMNQLSVFTQTVSGSTVAYPMFIAKDASGNVQPITAPPVMLRGQTSGTYLIAFGTGKYLETSDRATTAQNSFYVLYDDGTGRSDGGSSNPIFSAIKGRSRLKQGTVDTTAHTITTPAFTWKRSTSDSDSVYRSGWYFDFPSTGERQVGTVTALVNQLIFGSLIPDTTAATSVCTTSGGSGNTYDISLYTGNGTYALSNVGLYGGSLLLDAGDSSYTSTDSTGRRIKTLKKWPINFGSSGQSVGTSVTQTILAGRLSWRQIFNYVDLKDAS